MSSCLKTGPMCALFIELHTITDICTIMDYFQLT